MVTSDHGVTIYIYIILENLLDEKGMQYNYLDVSEIPHELSTYSKMYSNINNVF
jgi:hypothetical protein